ncbi:MAG TPA: universal stress protein [Burkholderiales bacterium]|nr:universal stress protein [Burkholderiales bacterium]
MYKRILLPFDSSSTAAHALAESIKLASEMKSKLRIVHVVNVGLPSDDDLEGIIDVEELSKKLHHLGQTLLDKAADTARKSGVEPETGLLDAKKGRVAAVLGEEAAKWHADLVVMGTHGRVGFEYLLMGSVAEEFIRIANAPILIVRG